jgi:hypothetical protein
MSLGRTKLAFDVVEPSDLLCKDTLEGADIAVEIAELDETKLAQGVDNLSSDFIRDVELHHTHVRRAERSILCWSHVGALGLQAVVVVEG